MRNFIVALAILFALSSASVVMAANPNPGGKGRTMSECAKGWDAYKKANNVVGKGSGKVHKKYMSDCLSGKLSPTPAPAPLPSVH